MNATVVRLRQVSRTYGTGEAAVHALRGIDVDIRAGELTTISGPSGSGKSTLLNILGLLDRPSEGSYELDGRDVSQCGERERAALRARTLGFVFQSFHLIGRRTVRDNVTLGGLYAGVPRARVLQRAEECLQAVGMSHRAAARTNSLSGGEKQRVAIARALVAEPELLLCDEPTGNLDTSNSAAITDLLLRLVAQGRAVVIVTHEQRVAQLGAHRIVIEDGRSVA